MQLEVWTVCENKANVARSYQSHQIVSRKQFREHRLLAEQRISGVEESENVSLSLLDVELSQKKIRKRFYAPVVDCIQRASSSEMTQLCGVGLCIVWSILDHMFTGKGKGILFLCDLTAGGNVTTHTSPILTNSQNAKG